MLVRTMVIHVCALKSAKKNLLPFALLNLTVMDSNSIKTDGSCFCWGKKKKITVLFIIMALFVSSYWRDLKCKIVSIPQLLPTSKCEMAPRCLAPLYCRRFLMRSQTSEKWRCCSTQSPWRGTL